MQVRGRMLPDRLEQSIGQQAKCREFLSDVVVQILADAVPFEAGDFEDLPLQLLPSCGVVEDASEPAPGPLHLTDCQVHRKDRAILAPAADFTADADDSSLAGLEV